MIESWIEMKSKNQRMTEILFIIYLIALVWVIVYKMAFSLSEMSGMRSLNLTPYAAPTRINGEILYEEMYFNVLAFVPFGVYMQILFEKWNVFQKILIFLTVSFSFEMVQYIFEIGASDITDIINNVLGGIIGLIVYKGIERAMDSRHQTHKSVNIFAAFCTLVVLIFLFIMKVT